MPRVKLSKEVRKAVNSRPKRLGAEVPIMTQKDAEAVYYALTGRFIRIAKLKCPCSLNDFIIWAGKAKPKILRRRGPGKKKVAKVPFLPTPGPFTPWSTRLKEQ